MDFDWWYNLLQNITIVTFWMYVVPSVLGANLAQVRNDKIQKIHLDILTNHQGLLAILLTACGIKTGEKKNE